MPGEVLAGDGAARRLVGRVWSNDDELSIHRPMVARCALLTSFSFLLAALAVFVHHYVLMTDAYIQAILAQ
jgi:hypothetical protein